MKATIRAAAACLAILAAHGTLAASQAVSFLKSVEGFRATAYKDSGGKHTIGYGFTAPATVSKGSMTEAEASTELSRICRGISAKLRAELGKQKLTPQEETAVVSFIYNVGWDTFKRSTMCRLLKEGKRGEAVAAEFSKWVYVTKGGKKVVSKGLKRRRARERRKFMG